MTLRLAILGDSIAYGIGASRPADTLAARLTAGLSAVGLAAESRVFAVSGARSADLARQAGSAAPWRPGVAVIVIGANDLTRLTPPEQAAGQLGAAVRVLREAGAAVVVAPAPDLSVVPYVPPAMRELVRTASRVLREAQSRAVTAAGGVIADPQGAVSASFAADPALFSADRFHPSSAGYARIAQALVPAVRAAAGTAGDEVTAASG